MSDPLPRRAGRLVVVTGPVASGKSTTALALAGLLRQRSSVAVIDLDQVYCMARQRVGFGEPDAWRAARRACGALFRSFLGSGIQTVIVEGEFFSPEELRELADEAGTSPHRIFTLQISYEEALRRVPHDGGRVASRNPTILKRLHESFAEALPFLRDATVVIDAESQEPHELAARIRALLPP